MALKKRLDSLLYHWSLIKVCFGLCGMCYETDPILGYHLNGYVHITSPLVLRLCFVGAFSASELYCTRCPGCTILSYEGLAK
jgi:hypothetical protein